MTETDPDLDPLEAPVRAVQARLPGTLHVPEADRGRRIVHEPTGTELVSARRFEPTRWITEDSRFANPFRPAAVDESITPARAVALYEGWFRAQLVQNDAFATAVRDLSGERLGCWCLPERCHGEVILSHLAAADE